MPLTLTITKEISPELLEQIVEMDHEAYPPEDQMTWEKAGMIYGLIKDSLILLWDAEQLIGQLSIYGISPDLVQMAIKKQKPIFHVEEKRHLMAEITPPCDAYIQNIIIKPAYIGKGYRKYLLLGLKQWLQTHPGIRHVWADAVSIHGQRSLQAIGLSPVPALNGLWGGNIETVHKTLSERLDGRDLDSNLTQVF